MNCYIRGGVLREFSCGASLIVIPLYLPAPTGVGRCFFGFVILFYISWTRGGAIMGTITEIFTMQPDGKCATIEQSMAVGRRPEGGDRS